MPGLLGHGQSFKSRDKDCKVCGGRGQVWWGGGGVLPFYSLYAVCYAMLCFMPHAIQETCMRCILPMQLSFRTYAMPRN